MNTTSTPDRELPIIKGLLEWFREKDGLCQEKRVLDRVAAVVRRISLAADLHHGRVEFVVFDYEPISSYLFRLDHLGIVGINSGCCNKFERDDEVAAFLSHQVARYVVQSRRSPPRDSSSVQERHRVCPVLWRRDEFLADALSIEYLRKAGYNPKGVLRVLEEYRPQTRRQKLDFSDRIWKVERRLGLTPKPVF